MAKCTCSKFDFEIVQPDAKPVKPIKLGGDDHAERYGRLCDYLARLLHDPTHQEIHGEDWLTGTVERKHALAIFEMLGIEQR